jgi:hypothetical protein
MAALCIEFFSAFFNREKFYNLKRAVYFMYSRLVFKINKILCKQFASLQKLIVIDIKEKVELATSCGIFCSFNKVN